VDAIDAIRTRRSFRGLDGPPLTTDEVMTLVDLALRAPAPHHTRPWRFVHVGPARRASLADAMGASWTADMAGDGVPTPQQERAIARSRGRILDAPTLLLGCLVAEGLRAYEDDRRARAEWMMAGHSFGAAMENIMLAAHAQGLGAYWISAPLYAQDAVRASLDLDAAWQPQACLALGRRVEAYEPFARPAPDLGGSLIER